MVGARGPGPVEVSRRDATVGLPDLSEYTRWGVEGLRHGLSPQAPLVPYLPQLANLTKKAGNKINLYEGI